MPGKPSINCRRFIYTGIMLLLLFSMLVPSQTGRAQADKQTEPPQPTSGITEGGTPTAPTSTLSSPAIQQFTAGGYVLGFQADGFLMAGVDRMLKTTFVDAKAVQPLAEGNQSPTDGKQKAPPLGKVRYAGLWDGVNLIVENDLQGAIKIGYQIAAGGSVDKVRLHFNRTPEITKNGGLLFRFEKNELRLAAPQAWQEEKGAKHQVTAAYKLNENGDVMLDMDKHDPVVALAVEGELLWNTFLGDGWDFSNGNGIVVDGDGNAYVTGFSQASWGIPVRGYSSGGDAFVTKLNGSGDLIWNTFLGGEGSDAGYGIAMDESGNMYVIGDSSLTWGAPLHPFSGDDSRPIQNAFIAKLSGSGNLLWNTFLGEGYDYGRGIAVDISGNIFVTGFSYTTWGTPLRTISGNGDAFAAKLRSDGELLWNTFLGSAERDDGYSIAVDKSGNAFVTGYSDATWGTPLRRFSYSSSDAFVAKLSSDGELLWNTFLGGPGRNEGSSIAVDDNGNAFLTGLSAASWGAPLRPYTNGGGFDAFVTKLSGSGDLLWNTFLGGEGNDYGFGITEDSSGNAFVTGQSSYTWGTPLRSSSFNGDALDAFIAKLSPNGDISWNTFLGGMKGDGSKDIAIDNSDNVFVTGDGGDTWGTPLRPFLGNYAAFVAKLNGGVPSPTYSISGKVTDNLSNPIPNITIADNAGHSTTTNASGDYSLANLVAGIYTIAPSSGGTGSTFTPPNRIVAIPPSATALDFQIVPISPNVISGQVTDESTKGVPNVTITSSNGSMVTTDNNGAYTLTGITTVVDITPTKTGCTFTPAKRSAVVPGTSGQNFVATCTPLPTTITGRVTNKSNGAGLAGVTIIPSSGTEVKTASDGTYTLTGITSAVNITPSLVNCTFDPAKRYTVAPGTSGQDFVATCTPPLTISGRVTNKSDSTGIGGVIIIPSSGKAVLTDSDGTYTLTGITVAIDITPSLVNCTFEPAKRSAVAPGASGQDFAATCTILPKTITGRVTNKSGGAGLAGVTITPSSGIAVITASDGTYTLSGITAAVDITPSMVNCTFEPAKRSAIAPGASGQDFAATCTVPSKTITGRVTNQSDGAGMAWVTITPSSGSRVITASDGTYTLSGITAAVDISASNAGCSFTPSVRSAVAPGSSGQDFVATCIFQATRVGTGNGHTCILTTNGGVKCWGYNASGQLGNGTTTHSLAPVDVSGLTSGVSDIAIGEAYSCALMKSGGVKCWGFNQLGQLGNNSTASSSIPVDVSGLTSGVSAIAAGSWTTCAIVNGGAKCWGSNEYGQLGNGSTTHSSVPVDVSGLSSGVTAIDTDGSHVCALKPPQKGGGLVGDAINWVKCWGRNEYGQLGNGTNTNSLVPVDVSGLNDGVYTIAVGTRHTCTITVNNVIKCWGNNEFGQLGIGSSNVPISVSNALEGMNAITAGYLHTCGITINGAVKCWGDNLYGQLGNNSYKNSNSPVDVSGLTSGASRISAGVVGSHTCVLTVDGKIKCWGRNHYGQLGNCSTKDSPVPVDASFSSTCPTNNYSISGHITTANNKAVPGASVSFGSGIPVNTDSNGSYTFTLPAGTYTVQAALSGYAMKPKSLSVTLPPDASEKNFTAIDGNVSCRAKPDILDVLYILQYSASKRTAASQCPLEKNTLFLPACDVNLDDKCDIKDAMLILQCSAGKKNELCP